MSDRVFMGFDVRALQKEGDLAPISRVTVRLDEENVYTAGDDTGRALELDCPYATQQMANNILASVKGYAYRPYEATGAPLDPAAELGDGVNIGGIYSVLAKMNTAVDVFCKADISAPGEKELDHEYPYISSTQREIDRKIAKTRSQITKTAEEILLEVSGLESSVSSISTKLDSITLSVTNDETASTIKLMAGSAEIASQTISMSGLVTFTGLSSGTTTIDGACIKTGTIDAQRLNLTGSITFGDLAADVRNDVNDAYSMANSAQSIANNVDNTVSGWTYGGSTYIDGSRIMTGTVMASKLLGGTVGLLTQSESMAGEITITGASSSDFAIELFSYGAIRLSANYGDIYISNGYGLYLQLATGSGIAVIGNGDFASNKNGVHSCGVSGQRWSQVYAASSTIVTSDRNKKNSIDYDLAAYDALFDRLKPCSFKYNDGTSNRTHTGMIAQDVEDGLAAANMGGNDFAGFIRTPDAEGVVYSLRYEEFIALCIDQIQKLKRRVSALEGL